MPIAENNPLFKGLSGAIGKNIVIKQYPKRGTVVVTNYPSKRKTDSEKQVAQRRYFRYAIDFARKATVSPKYAAIYAKGITARKPSVNAVALADFLNAPDIGEVNVLTYTGAPGELIRVRAWDDFKVLSVTITIAKADGTIIEVGEALPRGKKGLWRMVTTVRNENVQGTVFTVVAKDLADNQAKKTVTISMAAQVNSVTEEYEQIHKVSASDLLKNMKRESNPYDAGSGAPDSASGANSSEA